MHEYEAQFDTQNNSSHEMGAKNIERQMVGWKFIVKHARIST